MKEEILKGLQALRSGEKRNFAQSVDLVVSFKGLDLKKNESKFSDDFVLPYGRGKDAEIVVFSDNLSDVGCEIIAGDALQSLAGRKRDVRKLANRTDFFLSEPQLMPAIGRLMGQTLAPRNKMPKIISGEPKRLVESYKKSVRLVVKSAPVVQCIVGKEDMKDDEIAGNVEDVLRFLETKLPRGRQNIGKVFLKFTMSKPVKIEVK